MKETYVYDLEGKEKEKIKLPPAFEEELREEIVLRAVLSEESLLRQPKGAYRWAGLETSARYVGRKDSYGSLKNRGQAMLPREFFGGGVWGRVRRIPSAVGGRRAHPPKPEKKIVEKINKKEWYKALRSALAFSTSNKAKEKLKKYGGKSLSLPVVVEDNFEELKKAKEVKAFIEKLFPNFFEVVKEKKKRKTGVRRKRKKEIVKYPKALLILTSKEVKAGKNLPGVDVVRVNDVEVRHLAPGGKPGRLLILTKAALKKIEKLEENVIPPLTRKTLERIKKKPEAEKKEIKEKIKEVEKAKSNRAKKSTTEKNKKSSKANKKGKKEKAKNAK